MANDADNSLPADKGAAGRPTSELHGNDASVRLLTRVLVGLLRQTAYDQHGRVENVISGTVGSGVAARSFETRRLAELGRAVVRKEFMDEADAMRYGVRISTLVDDLLDGSGQRGDVEVTAQLVDSSRLSAIVQKT